MYKAIDVARHIINYLNNSGKTVSNLKLQKLLYFVQGFYLALLDKPCFDDVIEAWDFGPVVPNVYREFKRFGSNSIPTVKLVYDFGGDLPTRSEYVDVITEELDLHLINQIVDTLSQYSASALVDMTHAQDPWKNVYNQYDRHIIIDIESIKKYFKEAYVHA